MIVKVGGLMIGLMLSAALGQLLGPEGFGIIGLANRIVAILIVFGLMGVRQVIIKEVSIAHVNKNYRAIGNIMHSAYWLNGSCTLLGSVLLVLLAPWISENIFGIDELTFPLVVFFLVLTPQVISRIYSSALVGYRKIWQSNLVEQALSIAVTSVLLLIVWWAGMVIDVHLVAILYAAGRITVTLTVGIYWRRFFKEKGPWDVRPKDLYKRSSPLFISTLSTVLIGNVGVIMLAVYTSAEDVGLYEAAIKLALLTSFLLQIAASATGPKIAILYDQGDMTAAQRMVKTVTWFLIILSVVPLLVFIGLGDTLLSLWGDSFRQAYYILIILSVGQFVNTATGVVGQVLIMTGHEIENRNIMILFAIINLMLCVILISWLGAIGAAYAASITVIGSNMTKVIVAKAKTGISTI